MKPVGLYIHVPFCAKKCPYCDFYSRSYRRAAAEEFVAAVRAELRGWTGRGVAADTLYFGGGTPSLLSPEQAAALVAAAREAFSLPDAAEVTLEANPDTVNPARLAGWRAAGVNRLSLGVQSADARELAALGRGHSVRQAARAVRLAAAAGFANLSADLMLGVPYQTPASAAASVQFLSELPLAHISAYLLKVEEGTPYQTSPLLAHVPDADGMADIYLRAVAALGAAGFAQYEISSFARPGFQSRHNLKYWRCGEYLGFGPAAHSYFAGQRTAHPPDLARYLAGGAPELTDPAAGGPAERLMLALRLSEGAPLAWFDALPEPERSEWRQKAEWFAAAGLVHLTEERLSLTPQGFLVSNSLLAELLPGSEMECADVRPRQEARGQGARGSTRSLNDV